MDYNQLKKLPFTELRSMAAGMGLRKHKSAQGYMDDIIKAFKEYEKYKKNKIDRYTQIEQLGERGKEGVVYLVHDKRKKCDCAMKCFRKNKSSTTLKKELQLQSQASKHGICPDVYDYDTVSKYIVMEKMDTNLFSLLKRRKGAMAITYQKQMVGIFQKLDEIGIFHGDASPLNFMIQARKLYIIDFGFAKCIDTALIKKFKTKSPNMKFMIVGFILKMREIVPEVRYEYLEGFLNKQQRSILSK